MNDIVKTLASTFSTNDLTFMLRSISGEKNINDTVVRLYAAAVTFSWVDPDEIAMIAQEMNKE